MEDRKTLIDYIGQTFLVFGITITITTAICVFAGDGAKGYSTMFDLGSRGIPVPTVFQFLLSSACVTFLRFVFFTDVFFKKISVAKRTVSLCASVILLVGGFAYLFGWFPVDDAVCWISFLICFGICVAGGAVVSLWKERAENRRLENGLKRLKEEKYGE